MEGWKSLWNPEYRGRLGQRLGFIEPPPVPGGPVDARGLGRRGAGGGRPDPVVAAGASRRIPVVVTTVTPTGAQRVRALFGESVRHCYLPYDLPGSVRRFLDRVQPRVAIILETEIWPTLYNELGGRGIPLVLASARLSTRSVDRYRRMASLFKADAVPRHRDRRADGRRRRAIPGDRRSGRPRPGDRQRQVRPRDPGRDRGGRRAFRDHAGLRAAGVDRGQHARRRGGGGARRARARPSNATGTRC